ncbi:hypothetical protein PF003_g10750 [Phytophthora fragariae]|nr:hypothetical protein PF003_g10750 [Phytophthora fragariae]
MRRSLLLTQQLRALVHLDVGGDCTPCNVCPASVVNGRRIHTTSFAASSSRQEFGNPCLPLCP